MRQFDLVALAAEFAGDCAAMRIGVSDIGA